PFGLASPAAWLREAGANVSCVDLALDHLDAQIIRAAHLVAFYLPMHTATRLSAPVIRQVRALNPDTQLCAYGLYAPLNEKYLRALGITTILGGEFEEELVALCRAFNTSRHCEPAEQAKQSPNSNDAEFVSALGDRRLLRRHPSTRLARSGSPPRNDMRELPRLNFRVPDRASLPELSRYARLEINGDARIAGYTETTRGCKHLCRHCPIVPVYSGQFRVVQRDVVLADIRQQIAAGARHITFGDPDFFNGIGHTLPIVQALHREFPAVTYDATIKIEHLLQHADKLPLLRDTGCLFVTSAVEAVDDRILELFDKGHTRADFIRVAAMFRKLGLTLQPTFVAFNPWISLAGYRDLLALIAELDLIDHVAPIQLAIRLLITANSRLLELPEVRRLVGAFDEANLCYPWQHPDPRVDDLQRAALDAVRAGEKQKLSRREIFARVWQIAYDSPFDSAPAALRSGYVASAPIPHLSEPWYC
ncbi:MAG: radical SAM protein, partial [Chloroflexi bacterium]|nr:radical SAM protein [Chloroflexota bacterium]